MIPLAANHPSQIQTNAAPANTPPLGMARLAPPPRSPGGSPAQPDSPAMATRARQRSHQQAAGGQGHRAAPLRVAPEEYPANMSNDTITRSGHYLLQLLRMQKQGLQGHPNMQLPADHTLVSYRTNPNSPTGLSFSITPPGGVPTMLQVRQGGCSSVLSVLLLSCFAY